MATKHVISRMLVVDEDTNLVVGFADPSQPGNSVQMLGGGEGGITDGDKGDITVSGTGAVWTVENDAITNAKLANVATSTIKGRVTAATGDPEDLTAAQVRTLINVADGSTANSADATLLDRSNHTGTQASSTISDFNSATRAQVEAELIAGTNITITPASAGATRTLTIAASGGSGSVTSVAMTVPTGLAVTGTPITTTGTLAVALDTGYVIPTQAALDAKLSTAIATDITATKTTLVDADEFIVIDSEDADAPKLVTRANVRIGLVVGPASATDNALARFDATTGKLVQNSGVLVSDSNAISGYIGDLNLQTGTTYTLVAADTGKVVECTNAAAITVTLPANAAVGFVCTIVQGGAGQITLSPAGSATLRNRQTHTKTAGQWSGVSLYVRTNAGGTAAEYVLNGDSAA